MNVKDGVHKPFFWKVNAVKNILDTGKYDWVLWMDCDAFFMDPGQKLMDVCMRSFHMSSSLKILKGGYIVGLCSCYEGGCWEFRLWGI